MENHSCSETIAIPLFNRIFSRGEAKGLCEYWSQIGWAYKLAEGVDVVSKNIGEKMDTTRITSSKSRDDTG